VLSSDLFDAFGVLRHAQGQATTPWRWQDRKIAEEGLLAACGGAYQLPARALPLQTIGPAPREDCEAAYQACVRDVDRWYKMCMDYLLAVCPATIGGIGLACLKWCKGIPNCCAACVVGAAIICALGRRYCNDGAARGERRCLEEKAACEERNRRRGYPPRRGATVQRKESLP
jgi:hypothetical protein